MSNVDLHPEELFDKEILGELTEEERQRLEAHVAICKACRLERLARDDFRVDLEEAALMTAEEASPKPKGQEAERALAPPSRRGTFRVRFALLAAAALLLVSAVAGAGWVGIQTIIGKREPDRTPEETSVVATVSAPPVGDAPPTHVVPAPCEEPAEDAAPPQEDPVAEAESEAPPAPALSPSVVARTEPPAATPDPPVQNTARSLFERANAARASGAYGDAVRLYSELQSTFPASAEARTSQAILGRLLLDRGDADGALRYFDAYLRGGGALGQEALVGKATALRRLGRTSEEAAAWQQLLQSYPGSAHAENARARLEEIGAK